MYIFFIAHSLHEIIDNNRENNTDIVFYIVT